VNATERLLGRWRQVAPDPSPASIFITFEPDGRLRYALETGTTQIILLTWRVDGDVLVSQQPGAPREDRAQFRFDGAGRLVVEREGERYTYERAGA
jgi:hypothetical protein